MRLFISALLTALLIVSCGYYNPYIANKNAKPISIHRSMWKNQTNELGLEATFYHSLSDWLRKTQFISLTEAKEEAEYVLIGKIAAVDYPEISYTVNNVANELRANVTVTFSLIEQSTGKAVWEKTNYILQETLLKVDNPTQFQANKKAALAEIADDLAEEIYLHIIHSVLRPNRDMDSQVKMDTEIK